ncbi:MAG: YlxR family protein [Lachnospiraceae bacterium]|nr:YlxR family protein [Lachnospiraceae bacterium]
MQTSRDSSEKRLPQRTCLGCRTVRNKNELIRIVRTPEGEIEVDESGRKNGRGAYICRKTQCLEKVLKTGALSRSLKTSIPQEIGERLKGEING